MVTFLNPHEILKDFMCICKTCIHLVQHNKQHHRKVLLNSFHLNGHTLRYFVITCSNNKQHPWRLLHSSFYFNGHTFYDCDCTVHIWHHKKWEKWGSNLPQTKGGKPKINCTGRRNFRTPYPLPSFRVSTPPPSFEVITRLTDKPFGL